MTSPRGLVVGCVLVVVSVLALAQTPQGAQQGATLAPAPVRPDYVLGPNDQMLINVPELDEINGKPYRVDTDGYINLPLIGRVKAAGLLVRGLEADLTTRAAVFARDPHVTIFVNIYRSEPVTFFGAFHTTGIFPLQGGHTLLEMLATVGGMQTNASDRIKITRRSEYGQIPLPNAVTDPVRMISTVEISLKSLTQNINPAEDIILQAYDTITAETAQPVYVNGEVTRPVAIPFGEQQTLSLLQALTQAGAMTPAASRGKIRILRPILGTSRRAVIEIDLRRVYAGKDNDFPLLPNDLVYVPRDSVRAVLAPIGTSLLTSLPYLIISLAISGSL